MRLASSSSGLEAGREHVILTFTSLYHLMSALTQPHPSKAGNRSVRMYCIRISASHTDLAKCAL